jgi:hypothetical protein
MDGGTISGNSAVISGSDGGNGGGVYIKQAGTTTFTMSGSAVISGNTATGNGKGGGVYMVNGTFIMSGGTINDANSAERGGGVGVGGGTFTMSGGTIMNNSAGPGGGGWGGGVWNNGTVILEGGAIRDNRSYDSGGGIFSEGSSSVTIKNGVTISGNTAPSGGGIKSPGAIIMEGGTISGNVGGGVNVEGTFSMSGTAVVDANNDVYLHTGKMITLTGDLSLPSGVTAAATITPPTYGTTTQVLDESPAGGGLVAGNHTKFAVTQQATGTDYWTVDSGGLLASSSDLMVNFGIKPADYAMNTITAADVTAAFTAVHNYLQSLGSPADLGGAGSPVHLGFYIDLPALNVAGYPVDDETSGYGKINISANAELTGHGALLRLIVVGINSFNAQAPYTGNGNGNTAHLVFQFQNVPGTHCINTSDTNAGGYKVSEMRKYLVEVDGLGGNFSIGLQNSGVPISNSAIIWAPKRYVANAGSGASTAILIEDKIWLPTERELFGSNTYSSAYETEANQASLEYYSTAEMRTKYDSSNTAKWYWEASPYSVNALGFCFVNSLDGGAYAFNDVDSAGGVAPAFCVW